MTKHKITIVFFLLFASYNYAQSNAYDLIIENVNIFDSKTKQVQENKTIYIKENIIVDIVDFTKPTKGLNIIKCDGQLVVPGFIDTHVHLNQIFGPGGDLTPMDISDADMFKQALKEQFLKYGTTTILELGQPEPWLRISTKWQNNSSIEYPNIYNSGAALKSDYSWPPVAHHAEIYSKEHAKEKLENYANLGIKHVKLYSWLNRRDVINVLQEAEKLSLIPFGHIDRGEVEISEGIDLGIRNFEHFFSIINGVLNVETHWNKLNKKYNLNTQVSIDEWTAMMILYFDYVASSAELTNKVDLLLDKMVSSESTISTTIHALASVAEETNFFSTFEYFPTRDKPYLPSFKNLNKMDLKNGIAAMMNFIKLANDKGVKLRIGTDCRYGGKAMINEFLLLAEVGIPIPDILQIATYNGATAMRIIEKYGVIEKGKIADLVIFEKSPLLNYKNFESKKTIVKNGELIFFEQLLTTPMLEKVINEDVDEAINWYNENKNSEKYYSAHQSQIIEVRYELIKIRKVCEAIEIFKFCQQEFEDYHTSYNWIYEENLDSEAFIIKDEGAPLKSIELLKYNLELFPDSWNAYHSLGDLYLSIGDVEGAKQNFSKSLILNPSNGRAKTMLKKLK